jgi:uncharacterized protein YcaQ
MIELSGDTARMLALSGLGLRGIPMDTAEGLNSDESEARDGASVSKLAKGTGGIDAAISRLGLLQIDSVNVFERAHYMPLFTRLGNYDKEALHSRMDASAHEAHGQNGLVEYWAHEASLIPVENLPLYSWRMEAVRNAVDPKPNSWTAFAHANKPLLDWIMAEILARGPMIVSQFDHDLSTRKGTWWGWSDVKTGLEWLFMAGHLTSAGRQAFSRRYALPEQVLPQNVVDAIAGAHELAVAQHRENRKRLLLQAADTLAVATAQELVDYHRQNRADPKEKARLLAELVESGDLQQVKVKGWGKDGQAGAAYIGARGLRELESAPAGTNPTTILSPFDPTVWYRDRAVNLFNFEYRIEIYTPKEKRIYGYYTLPILHNRKIVGRIDLKSERKEKTLMVQSVWAEASMDSKQVAAAAAAVAKHLVEVAKWQGLQRITLEPVGTMAADLAKNLIQP